MLKAHYERIIIGCCFLFVFTNVGLASTAFSVHQPYLVALDGIGDTGGSLILSVRTLTSVAAMIVVDRYYRLLDVRLGVFVASLFTAGGFVIYSVAGTLPVFFCGAFLLGLGYGLGGTVAMTYLANRWFASGIGGVVGFASMGSGFASIIMPLVVVQVINVSSLSLAFLVEGLVALALGIVSFVLLRNRPSDLGMKPYEGRQRKARKAHRMKPAPPGEHRALLTAMVMVGTFSCSTITYLSVLATSSGFDAVFAASLVSIAGAALTASKYVTGKLFDALGAPRGSAIAFAFALAGAALACCAGMGNVAIMVAAAVLLGVGVSVGSVGVSVWSIDLSEPSNRVRQIKNFQVAYALGGFIANTLPGIVKDLAGSYVVSYVGAFFVALAAAVIILRFYRVYEER